MAGTMSNNNDEKSSELFVIGNPVRLNSTCDPYHRVSLKMQHFMTTIDLIPVEWSLDVKSFFKDDKSKKDQKGVVDYNFEQAIDKFKKRCKKYGLTPKSGIRLMTTAESVYQEQFTNTYAENLISRAANNLSNVTGNVRQIAGSVGMSADQTSAAINNSLGPQAKQATEEVTKGFGGDVAQAAWDILMEGRQMSLPKVYQNSSYEPSLSSSIKLVSPYGAPKSIQQHVLEPLMYLLLLTSPDTSDGLSYGGHTYLRIKAYGTADINIGYISSIRVDRGGDGNLCNKYGQPLTANVQLTIQPAISGFACLSGKSSMQGLPSSTMLEEDRVEFKPLDNNYGVTTIDNVVNSFKKYPGSDKTTNNGEYPGGGLLGAIGNMASGVASAGGAIKKSVSGAMQKAMM